jgi:excinuclease ABC subunit B
LAAESEAAYDIEPMSAADAARQIAELEKDMFKAAENLEFEEAAAIRDRIQKIKARGFAA